MCGMATLWRDDRVLTFNWNSGHGLWMFARDPRWFLPDDTKVLVSLRFDNGKSYDGTAIPLKGMDKSLKFNLFPEFFGTFRVSKKLVASFDAPIAERLFESRPWGMLGGLLGQSRWGAPWEASLEGGRQLLGHFSDCIRAAS